MKRLIAAARAFARQASTRTIVAKQVLLGRPVMYRVRLTLHEVDLRGFRYLPTMVECHLKSVTGVTRAEPAKAALISRLREAVDIALGDSMTAENDRAVGAAEHEASENERRELEEVRDTIIGWLSDFPVPDPEDACRACRHPVAAHVGRWCRFETGAVNREGRSLICCCAAVDAAAAVAKQDRSE